MAGTITRGKVIRADLAQWDGKTATYSRRDATGGTTTGLAVGNEVDVLQVFGAGADRTRASIVSTLNHINTSDVTLAFAPGTWTIDSSLTIGANFTCRIPSGCIFSVSAGQTLTFDGDVHVEDPDNWYTGSGTVVVSRQGVHGGIWHTTSAERSAAITPTHFGYPPGSAFRYGVDPTGVNDSTTAIQNWVDATWAMYESVDSQGLWNGGNAASPVLQLPPGKFKISGTIYLPTGITIKGTGRPSNTTSHTRIVMNSTATSAPNGAGDNRNKPIFKFQRSSIRSGNVQVNPYLNMTIQDLEFWYVTLGNDFDEPLGGAGITFGNYPDGGCLSFDIDTVDTRIIGCCFQHSPCAVRINDVPASSSTRGDGFMGSDGTYMYFEDCEFDAGAAHVHATDSYVDLRFTNCKFYGGRHVYENAAGKVVYEVCQFFGGAFIDADDEDNDFTLFRVGGGAFDLCTTADSIAISNANTVDISPTMTGASGTSAIALYDCDGGRVHAAIQGSGYNASAGSGLTDFTAAIKMLGCRNVLVYGCDIRDDTDGLGSYNGFGILTGASSGRSSAGNFIIGNAVSAPFNGSTFNSQSRYINLASGDIRGPNYDNHTGSTGQKIGPWAGARVQPTYGGTVAIDASTANWFYVVVTDTNNFTIASPTNEINDGQRITIHVFNFSGGVMGTITWGADYKMSTWTNPANNFNRAIDFGWDGSQWREVSRTPADVPN